MFLTLVFPLIHSIFCLEVYHIIVERDNCKLNFAYQQYGFSKFQVFFTIDIISLSLPKMLIQLKQILFEWHWPSKRKWMVYQKTLEKKHVLGTVQRSGSLRQDRREGSTKREFRPKEVSPFCHVLLNFVGVCSAFLFLISHFFGHFTRVYMIPVFAFILNSCCQLFGQSSPTGWIKTGRFLLFLFLSFIYLLFM